MHPTTPQVGRDARRVGGQGHMLASPLFGPFGARMWARRLRKRASSAASCSVELIRKVFMIPTGSGVAVSTIIDVDRLME